MFLVNQRIECYKILATVKFALEDFDFLDNLIKDIEQHWPNVDFPKTKLYFPIQSSSKLRVRLFKKEDDEYVISAVYSENLIDITYSDEFQNWGKSVKFEFYSVLLHEYIHHLQSELLVKVNALNLEKMEDVLKVTEARFHAYKEQEAEITPKFGLDRKTLFATPAFSNAPATKWHRTNIRKCDIWKRYVFNTLEKASYAGEIAYELVYKHLANFSEEENVNKTFKEACRECLTTIRPIFGNPALAEFSRQNFIKRVIATDCWLRLKERVQERMVKPAEGQAEGQLVKKLVKPLFEVMAKEVYRILLALAESKPISEIPSRDFTDKEKSEIYSYL